MSDLTLVLQTILRSKEPLTAEQVARETSLTETQCAVYLCRLVASRTIKRAGVEEREQRGRPRVKYARKNTVNQI